MIVILPASLGEARKPRRFDGYSVVQTQVGQTRLWLLVADSTTEPHQEHMIPLEDTVEHEPHDCPCGPQSGWRRCPECDRDIEFIIHHPLLGPIFDEGG